MHGHIQLGRWLPFEAEQVLRRDGTMLWQATVNPLGIPLFVGFDRASTVRARCVGSCSGSSRSSPHLATT